MPALPRSLLPFGFTLIELLIVMAVLAIVISMSAFYLMGALDKSKLGNEREQVVQFIKSIQQEAILARGGKIQNLQFNTHELVATADSRRYLLKPTTSLSFTKPEVSFKKLTGEPSNPVTLTLKTSRYQAQIVINSDGIRTDMGITTLSP